MSFIKKCVLFSALLVFHVALCSTLCADEAALPAKKTVCLNMIVKNERDVIARCLSSVLPLIDYWVIVDTGSTDGTQEIIKSYMQEKGIPGELFERSWVNFSHNRNEAMKLARGKADYLFFIDADEFLEYEPAFSKPDFDKDYYYVTIKGQGTKWGKIQLVNNHQDWEFVGVLHEVIAPPASRSFATFEKVVNIYTTEGARSKDPQKYQKDAQILEEALKKDPQNSRYVFYLAQTYSFAQNREKALENYQKRVEMTNGFNEEVFWSLLQIGVLQEGLGMPDDVIIKSYQKAYTYNKTRLEPLYYLTTYYIKKGQYDKGYKTATLGLTLPLSHDLILVQEWMWDYGMLLEQSVCAYWLGNYEECKQISEALLRKQTLPEHIRKIVVQNLGFSNDKILEQICSEK